LLTESRIYERNKNAVIIPPDRFATERKNPESEFTKAGTQIAASKRTVVQNKFNQQPVPMYEGTSNTRSLPDLASNSHYRVHQALNDNSSKAVHRIAI